MYWLSIIQLVCSVITAAACCYTAWTLQRSRKEMEARQRHRANGREAA